MTNSFQLLCARNGQPYPEDDCACVSIPSLWRAALQDTIANRQDCACADQGRIGMDSGRELSDAEYQRSAHIVEVPLSDGFAGYACLSSQRLLVVNQMAWEFLHAFEQPRTLEKGISTLPPAHQRDIQLARLFASMGFLQPVYSDCACASGKETCESAVTDASPLIAWLHLTDRCNLRCSYCYLPHVREDMSHETGRAVLDAAFRSALANSFKQVKLKYAGGEPLLRFPLLVELHRYAQLLAQEHGLKLESVVLSNGTLLTAEMVETLKSLDLRLMISLDGLGHYHDAHRTYASGRGSFTDVAEAVELALANGLVPNISVTVSSRTAEGLPDVLAWILERELPFSLNFYRVNDLSAAHEDMHLDEEKIINGMLAAFKVIENNLPRRSFLGGIIDRANLSMAHTHTCGVGQNYLVFDQNGQVAKCQMHIYKPITDMRAAEPLAIIRADQTGVQNLSVEEKEGCKTCRWKYWCTGGCPLETYRATGRYDVKSPNCNIYKALFPEALRLEGLRLLKYQDDPEVVVKY